MKPKKPYTEMSVEELAQATSQYDRMVIDKTRPLNAKERKLWQQARRGRGRPKIGKGAKKISVSLEAELLRKTDTLAKRRGVNRSELIASFVEAGLRKAV